MVSDVFMYCSASEILRTTHSLMQHHILEDSVAKQHRCENPKSCMSIFFTLYRHNLIYKAESLFVC